MNREVQLHGVRRHYSFGTIDERTMPDDPFVVFEHWMHEAIAADLYEANAMALATATRAGAPSVRMVLLKSFDRRGFVFYGGYGSRKGRELAANPRAALLLWWDRLERQVRIEGSVERLSAAESDAYFARRPRRSQIAATSSPQSRAVAGRKALLARYAAAARRLEGRAVPRPKSWGGYRMVPARFEFWQGRADRLHDRFVYERRRADWKRSRLGP